MADSLILPIAPTRGEMVVVFTSVMAATCVGGRGAGWSATKTAKLAEKKAQFRRSVASTGSAAEAPGASNTRAARLRRPHTRPNTPPPR